MSDGFPNKPRILRGAFVEFGLSLLPLVVVLQFNPIQLTRNRSLTFAVPTGGQGETGPHRCGSSTSATTTSPSCVTSSR